MFDTEHLSLSCRPSVYAISERPLGEQPHHRGKRERHVEDIFALGGLCEFTLIHLSRFPLVMRLAPEGGEHVLHAGELDAWPSRGPSARDLELVELEPVLVGDASRLAPADQPLG